MNKNATFRPNLVVLGQKIKIFTGEMLLPIYQKTHLDILFAFAFGQAWDKMGKKCQYLAQNDQKCIFWTNFGPILDQILFISGVSKSFGTYIMGKPLRQLVRIVFWSGIRSNGPKMPIFGQKCQNALRVGWIILIPYNVPNFLTLISYQGVRSSTETAST